MLFEPWAKQNRLERAIDGARTLSFGIDFLDEALGGLAPADILVLGARTGNGKTQLATQIAMHTAAQTKEVYYFALEAEKDEIEMRMLYSEVARRFFALPAHERPLITLRYTDWRKGKYVPHPVIDALEEKAATALALNMSSLTTVYRNGAFTVENFCEQLEALQGKANLIILDHLHYFDWTEKNEYDALRTAIKKIRDTALQFSTPIILVAHLRKNTGGIKTVLPEIDDFHGSSDITKIATQVVLLARAEQDTQSGNSGTYLYIPKARAAGDAVGFVGIVGFNQKTGYYEPGYMLGKAKFGQVELVQTASACPRWTKNVRIG